MISARELKHIEHMKGLHYRSNMGILTKRDYRYIHSVLVGERLKAGRKMLAYLEGWQKYAKAKA